jgi:hypothetical protein
MDAREKLEKKRIQKGDEDPIRALRSDESWRSENLPAARKASYQLVELGKAIAPDTGRG